MFTENVHPLNRKTMRRRHLALMNVGSILMLPQKKSRVTDLGVFLTAFKKDWIPILDSHSPSGLSSAFVNSSGAPRSQWRTLLPAFLILAWRAATLPFSHLWMDWMGIAAVTFALRRILRDEASSSVVTLTAVTLLLGIYLYGQLPYTLLTLGWGR